MKNKQKSVWSNVFWYIEIYLFWKFIQYTILWNKIKKTPQESPSHKILHNFAFNLQFLFELKHKACLSKIVCGIFHFRFRFLFYCSLYFCSTKSTNPFTLKRHNFFEVKIVLTFVPRQQVTTTSYNNRFKNSMSPWVGVSRPRDEFFKVRKLKFWNVSFSQ